MPDAPLEPAITSRFFASSTVRTPLAFDVIIVSTVGATAPIHWNSRASNCTPSRPTAW